MFVDLIFTSVRLVLANIPKSSVVQAASPSDDDQQADGKREKSATVGTQEAR